MEEIIKPRNFEVAKQHIKTFSQNTKISTDLDKVSTSGGLFGLFNHNVSGEELNNVIGQVQEHLIRIYEFYKSLGSEFGQVYEALESLDSGYISAILLAVKGAEESSKQAKHAFDQAQKAQSDINKTIESQKKVITILLEHKKKLDTFKHLESIDDVWNDIKNVQSDIHSVRERIFSLESYQTELQSQIHVGEVDQLWEMTMNNATDFKNILEQVECIIERMMKCEQQYTELSKSLSEILSIKHLYDVDVIWKNVEEHKVKIAENEESIKTMESALERAHSIIAELIEYKTIISKQIHITDIDYIFNTCIENKKEIEQYQVKSTLMTEEINKMMDMLEDNRVQNQVTIEQLKSKVKYSYFIAVGAIGIAVVELILNLVGGR